MLLKIYWDLSSEMTPVMLGKLRRWREQSKINILSINLGSGIF